MMIDPFLEVGIEQRLASLCGTTNDLKEFAGREDCRSIMARSRCREDLEAVWDEISKIIMELNRA